MCLAAEGKPPSAEENLPLIDLPDMRVGRVVRRYSVYSHFYFIEITFAGLEAGTVFPIIVKEAVCPSFSYLPVRVGDIIRVFGEMEPSGKCFEAHEIEHFGKWDVYRYGVFQFRSCQQKKGENGSIIRYEERKLVLAVQCHVDVVNRVRIYLESKFEGYDFQESCTPITVSDDRLLLAWKKKNSETKKSAKKIAQEILADPILRYAVSRIYNIDKQRLYMGLTAEEAICELLNNTTIEKESNRVRLHAFPKFIDFDETLEVLKSCAPSLVFAPTNFTHVMVVLYANGIVYLSYLEKELATGCGQYLHQDTNLACLSVSKAAAKILEAVSRMDIPTLGSKKTALDIGAAPGGWSYYLKNVCGYSRVIAVDMGALAAPIPAGVEHWRMKGQDAVNQLVSECGIGENLVDIFTCDMNVVLTETVDLFLQAIHVMAAQSVAILTFKRTEKNKGKWETLKAHGLALIRENQRVVSAEETHLIANTPNETTVLVTLD